MTTLLLDLFKVALGCYYRYAHIMSNKLIYHAGTGTFFGADDDVYVIDLDSLVGEAREEVVYELEAYGEMPWEKVRHIAEDVVWGLPPHDEALGTDCPCPICVEMAEVHNSAMAKEECLYCGGDCPQSYMTGACDGYLGDIDGLYENLKPQEEG